jgi:hypothetical protein
VAEMLSSKKTLFSLRRAASFGMSLVLLTVFLTQFAVGTDENINISGAKFLDNNSNGTKPAGSAFAVAEGNISISGIKFLDANSNRIFDQSEQPLKDFAIYIDRDNTGQLQQGDPVAFTDKNGKYEFTNIPKKGFVRELISSGDQFQPSYPPNGYNLADVTDGTKDRLDFVNSIAKTPNTNIYWGFIILAAIIGAFGAILLFLGFRKLSSLTKDDIKEDKRAIIQIGSGFILLILGLCLLISGAQMSGNEITVAGGSFALVIPVILALMVFGAILLMLFAHFKIISSKDDPGIMRRTIAGLLVLGLIAVVLFSLSGKIEPGNQNIITQYIQLVGIVIAFYFGSKATSDAYKGAAEGDKGDANKDLEITNVTYNANEEQIVITGSNKNKRAFDVTGVYIDDGQKPLIDKTIVGVGVSEGLLEFPVTVAGLTDVEKTNMKGSAAGQKYNITIKTTMGDKTTQCEIVKK